MNNNTGINLDQGAQRNFSFHLHEFMPRGFRWSCFCQQRPHEQAVILLHELVWETVSSLWSCRWWGKPANELCRQHKQRSFLFHFWGGEKKRCLLGVLLCVFLCVCMCIYTVCVLMSFMEEWGDRSCERRKQHPVVFPETPEWIMKWSLTCAFTQNFRDKVRLRQVIAIIRSIILHIPCFIKLKWINNTVIQIVINAITLEKLSILALW